MRVALIPTGKLELLGLAAALRRLFGDQHEFFCVPRYQDTREVPFHSFTSARLPVASHHDPRSPLAQLVGAMVDATAKHRAAVRAPRRGCAVPPAQVEACEEPHHSPRSLSFSWV